MRSDMAKVIVERPRVGHRHGHIPQGRPKPLTDDDGAPLGFFARDHKRTKKTKWLNENLAPLRRYLQAQVGRPWAKVHSEICAHLRPTSTVQQHVLIHLEEYVAIHTRMVSGKVVFTPRWGGEQPVEDSYVRYFVHPRTGLLKANQRPPRNRARAKA